MVLRHALAQVRPGTNSTTAQAARPCFFCGITTRPLFAGVCTPCEDREKAQQRVDAYMPRHGLGRSRAAIWRQSNPNE